MEHVEVIGNPSLENQTMRWRRTETSDLVWKYIHLLRAAVAVAGYPYEVITVCLLLSGLGRSGLHLFWELKS